MRRKRKAPWSTESSGEPGADAAGQEGAGESRRVFPHNLDAERAILGGVLIDNEMIGEVAQVLRVEHLYREAHRKIWLTLVALYQAGQPLDLVTVSNRLQTAGQLEEIGGMAYLSSLPDSVPVMANLATYTQIVRETWVLRRALEISLEIQEQVYAGGAAGDVLDSAESAIFALSELDGPRSETISQTLSTVFDQLAERSRSKNRLNGLSTGLERLDLLLGGLADGQLIIVAGRPSMGKTALAVGIVLHNALQCQVGVGVLSLEMAREELVMRMLSSTALVDAGRMKTGALDEEDWTRMLRVADPLSEAPIYIDDNPSLSIAMLRAKARRLVREKGIRLLMVDYLQLMETNPDAENREKAIAEISRGCKLIARELKIPVILLSQLNRDVEKRTDKRPMMADLRESGAIEQDADVIIFCYRQSVYMRPDQLEEPEYRDLANIAELIVGKQRSGAPGMALTGWCGPYAAFVNLAPADQDLANERYRERL